MVDPNIQNIGQNSKTKKDVDSLMSVENKEVKQKDRVETKNVLELGVVENDKAKEGS